MTGFQRPSCAYPSDTTRLYLRALHQIAIVFEDLDLSPDIRAVVDAPATLVLPVPAIQVTDERLRFRCERFGEWMRFAGAFVAEDEKLVIVHQAPQPPPDGWTIPAGVVEPSEPLTAAPIRESREECGLEIELLEPIAVVRARVVAPTAGAMEYAFVLYLGKAIGGSLRPEDWNEIAEARWVSRPEVEALHSRGEFPSIHPHVDPAVVTALRALTFETGEGPHARARGREM